MTSDKILKIVYLKRKIIPLVYSQENAEYISGRGGRAKFFIEESNVSFEFIKRKPKNVKRRFENDMNDISESQKLPKNYIWQSEIANITIMKRSHNNSGFKKW